MNLYSLTFLLVFSILTSLFSQEEQVNEAEDTDFLQLNKSKESILPQRQFLETALDRAIDPDQYKLGPGDQLLISISGLLQQEFYAEVSPESNVLIPSVGGISVKGMVLTQAKSKITEELSKRFKNSDIFVNLVRLRKFRVYVLGLVKNPGTYFLRASDRISDAIELASGITNFADDTNIEVTETDGTKKSLDLSKYFSDGVLESNPHLNGGETIHVPKVDFSENYVIIDRAIIENGFYKNETNSENIFQIKKDETILELLNRINAFDSKSNLENITLIRDSKEIVLNLLSSNTKNLKLVSRDRIVLSQTYSKVYVQGEVMQPGAFWYVPDYRAKDYAGMAGILETAKSLADIEVIRAKNGIVERGGDISVERGDIVNLPRKTRESVKDFISIVMPIVTVGISLFAIIQTN